MSKNKQDFDHNDQKKIDRRNLKYSSGNGNNGAGSLAWIGHKPPKLGVVGSNPTPPVLDEPRTVPLVLLEDFVSIVIADIPETCLYELTNFFF